MYGEQGLRRAFPLLVVRLQTLNITKTLLDQGPPVDLFELLFDSLPYCVDNRMQETFTLFPSLHRLAACGSAHRPGQSDGRESLILLLDKPPLRSRQLTDCVSDCLRRKCMNKSHRRIGHDRSKNLGGFSLRPPSPAPQHALYHTTGHDSP